jgi:AhpD family alkylhydroperoxidase
MRLWQYLAATLVLGLAVPVVRAQAPSQATTVPATRTEMKEWLEGSKKVQSRLPLPPPTEEEKVRNGDRPVVNNGRLRMLYLPAELRGGDFMRGPDPGMSLDATFKTRLFWIVSRTNNCRYCLGHQEIKLTGAGMSDDQIAALDCNWAQYPEAEQAAFALARKLTYDPHRVGPADLEPLRKHYKDVQILEILFTVANNNATNRWTGAFGITQDQSAAGLLRATGKPRASYPTFLTPTSAKYRDQPSKVAPLGSRAELSARRPALEKREQVEEALAACRARNPRLPLVAADRGRALLAADWPGESVPAWVRLLANFPKAGAGRVLSLRTAEQKGNLDPLLKCQVAWIAARHDRAWYALGHAKQRLAAHGLSDDAIYALDGSWESYKPAQRAAFAFARNLTTTPEQIDDEDIAQLRKHYRDGEVAELVLHLGNAAFFNRVTEASGLPLEAKE